MPSHSSLLCGPLGCLVFDGLLVGFEPVGVLFDELLVVEPFFDDDVGHCQRQRAVGPRLDLEDDPEWSSIRLYDALLVCVL
ncbi:MAG: hypothetical protein V5A27_07415 [Halapricum sp.]